MTNTNLLKAKMVAAGDEHFTSVLADVLHISRTTASKKLNSVIDFTQSEIIVLKNRYELSPEEVSEIFVEGD